MSGLCVAGRLRIGNGVAGPIEGCPGGHVLADLPSQNDRVKLANLFTGGTLHSHPQNITLPDLEGRLAFEVTSHPTGDENNFFAVNLVGP